MAKRVIIEIEKYKREIKFLLAKRFTLVSKEEISLTDKEKQRLVKRLAKINKRLEYLKEKISLGKRFCDALWKKINKHRKSRLWGHGKKANGKLDEQFYLKETIREFKLSKGHAQKLLGIGKYDCWYCLNYNITYDILNNPANKRAKIVIEIPEYLKQILSEEEFQKWLVYTIGHAEKDEKIFALQGKRNLLFLKIGNDVSKLSPSQRGQLKKLENAINKLEKESVDLMQKAHEIERAEMDSRLERLEEMTKEAEKIIQDWKNQKNKQLIEELD